MKTMTLKLFTGEVFHGNASQIVAEMMNTSRFPYESADDFMRQWAQRSMDMEQKKIDASNPEAFIDTCLKAGYFQEMTTQ